ncbi:hypothetical protein Tco_0758669 [Tanacetum coccineum]
MVPLDGKVGDKKLSKRSWVTEWKGLPLLYFASSKKQSRVRSPGAKNTIMGAALWIVRIPQTTVLEITSKQSNDSTLS